MSHKTIFTAARTLAGLLLVVAMMAGCESRRYDRGGAPGPERVYTVLAPGGGSDEVIVRCPGAYRTREAGFDRHRVHCIWEFRKNTNAPLRFDPGVVRLVDPEGRSFGPSEVRVNGRGDAELDLSRPGAALVDVFFDLGTDYRLRRLDVVQLQWALDLGDSVKSFDTQFYQEARYSARDSSIGLSLGYGHGWRSGWSAGIAHSIWLH